jgi:ribose transport system substrate-binding protein
MGSIKKKLLLVPCVLACLQFTGCQYRSRHDTYYLVASNLKLPYWKSVQDGFNQAAEEYAVTAQVEGPDTYDPQAEADAFSKVAARHPAGILVSAADANRLREPIRNAITSGVPVITVDSDAPTSARLYFIGTNNLEAGRLGGKRLVEKLDGKGNVVVFSIPGQPNLEERLKGYKDALAGSPGIKIVEVVATGGDSGSAFDKTDAYLHRSGPDKIDAFVCLESSSGDAVGEVLKRNNVTDRTVIAMDADPESLGFINDGTIDSTIAQKPFTMGYVGLHALDSAHHAKNREFRPSYVNDSKAPFPAFVDTGSTLITKLNLSLYEGPQAAK